MSISATITVFNEERRIESTLKSFAWCDEIVLLDKQSTDKTVSIAKRFTNNIIVVPWQEFRAEENKIILDLVKSEWVFSITASDLIHPKLAAQILELTREENFPYDVIHIPFRRYVLGLDNLRSPWHGALNPLVFRKSVVKINYNSVHSARYFDTDRNYQMPKSDEYCMYHLTHETVDLMMDRHMRYWHAEAKSFPPTLPLSNALKQILVSIYDVLFKRKTWLTGWDGVALIMAFLSYSVLRFVYIWEQRCSKAPQIYLTIRESVSQAWSESERTNQGDK